MPFRSALFISLILSLFAVQGLAQTDSVYSRMILGSAGFKSIFGSPDQYASTQETILSQLKSTELAARAVYKCFEKQPAPPEAETVSAYAKKCSASLNVHITSGDTAVLAFGNPNLEGIAPEKYLDNLMFVLIEYNVESARAVNQRELDSLDTLLDQSYLVMMSARDTLYSFCNSSQFRSSTHKLLHQLLDTVAEMKKQLHAIGYASQDITMMFYQLDTAMHRLKFGYQDTLSASWDPKYAGVGLAVYDCEYILRWARSAINASLLFSNNKTTYPHLNDFHRSMLYLTLHEIIAGDLVSHFYKYNYVESRTPAKGTSIVLAQQHYQLRSAEYHELLAHRTNTLALRNTIFAHAYVLCIASKVKC